jgi:eukaryotic-like serine/threonine-protein kinase
MGSPIALGPFDLLSPAGQGGMGEVWSAVHRTEGLAVAVKVVRPALAGDPELRELFRHEVRAAAALDHPNVVLLFDHGEVDDEAAQRSAGRIVAGSPYLVMEWASGGTLASRGPFAEWKDLERALLTILDALAHAHARGVVHRDLKLSNVLLGT